MTVGVFPDMLFLGALLTGLAVLLVRQTAIDHRVDGRARRLLAALLTAQEQRQLARKGYIDIPSPGHRERVYRVGDGEALVKMYERRQLVALLCVGPTAPLPAADVLLSHKLLIEGAEEHYLRVANRLSPGRR